MDNIEIKIRYYFESLAGHVLNEDEVAEIRQSLYYLGEALYRYSQNKQKESIQK